MNLVLIRQFHGALTGLSAPHSSMPLPPPLPYLLAQFAPSQAEPRRLPVQGLKTNLQKRSIPLSELTGGGPPKDGIPALDQPKFVSGKEAAGWLQPREPVLTVKAGDEVRGYPLQILMWHELVNDELGDTPVLISYCPLCNTALAFNRTVRGRVLRFGVSGLLRHSDLVMFDRETESLWQQATGEAIVGEFTSTTLEMLPAQVLPFDQFLKTYPGARVLSRDTGHVRDYGRNPYVRYDAASKPWLFKGHPDPRLPPMERLVTVSLGGTDKAYPFRLLRELRVVNDRVGTQEIVVFFSEDMASAVDQKVMETSRDVGSVGVFLPEIEGRTLHFKWESAWIKDEETGSVWNVVGLAVEGPLKGRQLKAVPHGTPFAFAWLAFKPKTLLFTSKP